MAAFWSAVLLAAVLLFAVARPRGLPEAVAAVPAALVVVLTGLVPVHAAVDELRTLAPAVAFLAAVLVLGELCDRCGVFAAAGHVLQTGCRSSPRRMLALVVVLAGVTTAVLSLDATVVLLTPAVLAATAATLMRSRPHVYACTHLANTGSLLMPVSNLTNLLAFGACGLSFARFTAVMALPWVAASGAELALLRRAFRTDLGGRGEAAGAERMPVPVLPVVVVALTLAGFVASGPLGVSPVWAAGAGATVLAAVVLGRRRARVQDLVGAASPGFLAFVLALGVVVRALVDAGAGHLADRLLPGGASWLALAGAAVVAAVLANLLNNLPAVLLLIPAAAAAGPATVLAVLVGVNLGPNLTFAGSLATLLWRRMLAPHGADPTAREFTRVGAVTVPVTMLVAVTALWLSWRVLGG